MDFEEIIYVKEGGIATITLNRPQTLNALAPSMINEWVMAIEDAKHDDEVKVLIVTGAGRAFCSGADVRGLDAGGDRTVSPVDVSVAERRNFARLGIQRIPRAVEEFEKPYIAAINGPAIGGGMDMASMCDIRIASDRARVGITHLRMGQLSADGGYYFLERIIGVAKTLELAWTARIIDAQEMLEIGYVSKVVPQDELMAATRELATQLANGPAVSIQLAKRLIYRGWESTVDMALEDAEVAMLICQSTEDAREGPRAFIEKREPRFKGR